MVQGSDGNSYGATYAGGKSGWAFGGYGTVFKISANGALASLYSFTGGNDGANPHAALVQGGDGSFYGPTLNGGTSVGYGTVFKISTNALTTLYAFGSATNASGDELDCAGPNSLVQRSDGYFYRPPSYARY